MKNLKNATIKEIYDMRTNITNIINLSRTKSIVIKNIKRQLDNEFKNRKMYDMVFPLCWG